MDTIAVAAVSARVLAEAAAAAGCRVLALDAYGDLDTRRAAAAWFPIGREGAPRIDRERCLAGLRRAAAQGATGWIAGAGFEAEPGLLEAGTALLPLLGTAPRRQRATREPAGFFRALDEHGIAHPPVRFAPPEDASGWLLKDAAACGGWHIRRAEDVSPAAAVAGSSAPSDSAYWQHTQPGTPMSACVVADGRQARVLGCNRLLVRPLGTRPHVYAGAIGPVPLGDAPAAALAAALQALVPRYEVRGLASLDFMLDGDHLVVLELNARPSASMALYERLEPGRTIAAHLAACRHGRLPEAGASRPGPAAVEGSEIVYAPRPLRLELAAAGRLAAWPAVHDLPAPGAVFAADEPICSLAARGRHAAEVEDRLTTQRLALLHALETS